MAGIAGGFREQPAPIRFDTPEEASVAFRSSSRWVLVEIARRYDDPLPVARARCPFTPI